jgi:serine/threonine-protein kinase RsbW
MGEDLGAACTCGTDDVPGLWKRETFRTTAEVIPLLDRLVSELHAANYSAREVFGIRLALEEAMVNAVQHGNKGDPSKLASLRYHVRADHILAEVEDQGPGFDPNVVPDPRTPENRERPGGRGLLLMRYYMTWVRYNAAGNAVALFHARQV